jgi:uncharacterized protein YecT (DUF1311 family)
MPTLAILALAAAVAGRPAPDCDGNTREIETCLGERLKGQEARLATYVTAARKRIREEAAESPNLPGLQRAIGGFDAAEAAWRTYRDAECGAVYDYHSAGTVRGVKSLKCRMLLTQRHTHTVWEQWLRYEDSTPPILPEPPPAAFP